MPILNNKKIINFSYIVLLIILSFFINWKYSRYGVFPIDTFLHYDSAYRILNGEYPVKDFWVVSGFFVDFIQAFFFKIFNISWYSYIFHSSILNVLFTILTFYLLVKLNLEKKFALFYSISFSILAYPVSGTPFVDLHATFFCVIATYFTFLAIKKPDEYLNWFLVVSFYFFALMSKVVPTAYFLLLNSIVVFLYLIANKKIKPFIIILLSLSFYLLILFLFLSIFNIEINSLYIQYIGYPLSIGLDRLDILSLSIYDLINEYKFILIPLLFLALFKLNNKKKKKILFSSSSFFNFLIFIILCLSLFFHQLLTKNQTYIYFLIPLSFALLQIEINNLGHTKKKLFTYLTIFLVIFSTVKYHIRYNENRKFHDLANTNISEYAESFILDKSLKGILWISPHYDGNPQSELEVLKKIKHQLNKKKNIMVLTHYLFLDSITQTNLNSPSRTHTLDGASIPLPGNKYFDYYKKNFLYKKLIEKNINEVYFIRSEGINVEALTQFFKKKCYQRYEEGLFILFKLKKSCFN